jgi:BlaI family transcriptional regulator, penicillinase repressor
MARFRMPGGELEYAVLAALWSLGHATAREVHARVAQPAGLAYTTTATVLDRLHDKGLVAREKVDRAFQYRPRVKRGIVERTRLREAVEWLLGSDAQPAMARLVDAVESLGPDLVDELTREVAKRRKARRGP